MVGGMMKSYPNFTPEYLLFEMSYQNLILYSSIIPSYDFDKNGKKKRNHERINGDDPKNRDKINREIELLG
jgi:hypothetical protein